VNAQSALVMNEAQGQVPPHAKSDYRIPAGERVIVHSEQNIQVRTAIYEPLLPVVRDSEKGSWTPCPR
jgi:hypothetical protein